MRVIIFIVILSFSQALYLLSYDVDDVEFSNPAAGLTESFVYMIEQINISQLHDTRNSKLAQFLMVAFVLVSTILMLNILIAQMNSAYSKIARNALGEWNRERAIIITQQPYFFYKPIFKEFSFYLIRNDDVKKQSEAKDRCRVDVKALNVFRDQAIGSDTNILKVIEACEKMISSVLGVVNELQNELSALKASNQRMVDTNQKLEATWKDLINRYEYLAKLCVF